MSEIRIPVLTDESSPEIRGYKAGIANRPAIEKGCSYTEGYAIGCNDRIAAHNETEDAISEIMKSASKKK